LNQRIPALTLKQPVDDANNIVELPKSDEISTASESSGIVAFASPADTLHIRDIRSFQ
jgi:hypothetical protein